MNRILVLALLVMLSLTSQAFAHGTGSMVMGTVTAIAPTKITVKAADGDIVPVPVNEKTEYRRGAANAALSDVAVGMRVVIEVDEKSGAPAKSVRLPATNAAAPADHSAHHAEGHDHGEQEPPASAPH